MVGYFRGEEGCGESALDESLRAWVWVCAGHYGRGWCSNEING